MKKLLPKQYAKILHELADGRTGKELSEAVAVFAGFIKKQRVVSRLPHIIEAFEVYAKEKQGIQSLSITSAQKLSDALVKKIADTFGKNTEVETSEDAALIGGVVVRNGNTIFDGSVKTQIEQLSRTLS